MGSRQPLNVIDLDGPRLSVLSASVAGSKIAARTWLAAARPEGVAADDAEAVGRWVGEELRKAGLHRHRALLAVSRSDVVLKSMDFPVAAGMSDAELAGAVRLQMSRQLTMPLEGTAIDYAKLSEKPAEGGQLATVAVLAGAMPADRVNWCRAMARAAGLNLHRIGLRCCGVAALLGEISQRRDGPVLGIAPGWASAEFVVVRDGQMVFARAVDIVRPGADEDVSAYAERIAVEAKRTWMSYQGARGSSPVQMIAVVVEPELASAVGVRAEQALEVPWEPVAAPAGTEFASSIDPRERAAATALIGMVLEEALDRPRLDFANTKKAVDPSAIRRQRVLLGVLGAILVSGTSWVLAQQSLDALARRVAAAKQTQTERRDEYERYQIEFLRVNHLERWRSVKVDWLAHLSAINEQLPDPRQATADEISGRVASAEVSFSPKKSEFVDDDWTAQQLLEFVVRGRVNHRDVAADLRGRLMNSKLYTVENKGPDVPDKFSLSLLTTQATPAEKVEKPEPKPAAPPPAAPAPAGKEKAK
ncbi:MAG: pilus assembly protein PilM [Phycisphaerales bacterium]|nr:pilus assembly protein PilM [Phycisphaerales bacterium]